MHFLFLTKYSKTPSGIQNTFPLRNCLFIFNSKWSSHKWSTSGERKITWVRLLICINNTKSHFNETAGSRGLKEGEMCGRTDGIWANETGRQVKDSCNEGRGGKYLCGVFKCLNFTKYKVFFWKQKQWNWQNCFAPTSHDTTEPA